jgi:5-methylcytosine-specific restriction endonuclease McrA
MTMILQKIKDLSLDWLEHNDRKRIIMDRTSEEPLLTRYYVFLKDRKWFPFNVFIHKFHKSDPDDVHDHPWPYATLILAGGYYEYVPEFNSKGEMIAETKHWRKPGHFRTCSANSYHRIELDPTVTAWTMFMPGPQKREWGFLVKNKWIHNEHYLEERRQ